MTIVKFASRIRVGRLIRIPPVVIKRLGLVAGSQIDCHVTVSGKIEITRALTPDERRNKRLRERLLEHWNHRGMADVLGR